MFWYFVILTNDFREDNASIIDHSTIRDDPLPFPGGFAEYHITKSLTVENVINVISAPEYWPVPTSMTGKTAYIIDLRDNPPDCIKNGEKRMDSFIRQEVSSFTHSFSESFLNSQSCSVPGFDERRSWWPRKHCRGFDPWQWGCWLSKDLSLL